MESLLLLPRGQTFLARCFRAARFEYEDSTGHRDARASALLAAGERKFKQACPHVEISSAIAEMTKDGNEVKS